MKVPLALLFGFALAAFIGCEKEKNPFSADPVRPPQGVVDVIVLDKSTPVPNVLLHGIDPLGNILTTITDSTGTAIFNPIPFNAGNWTFQMPDQNHRCFGANSQSVTATTGVNSEAVTFQYGVPISLNGFSISLASALVSSQSGNIILNSNNDCGVTWAVNLSLSGNLVAFWTVGSSGQLHSGQICSFDLTSGKSISWSVTGAGSVSNSITISSPVGSVNCSNCSGITTTF